MNILQCKRTRPGAVSLLLSVPLGDRAIIDAMLRLLRAKRYAQITVLTIPDEISKARDHPSAAKNRF